MMAQPRDIYPLLLLTVSRKNRLQIYKTWLAFTKASRVTQAVLLRVIKYNSNICRKGKLKSSTSLNLFSFHHKNI